MTLPKQKTKIVATIGPASASQEVLEQMIKAGMNVARINFSHGDFQGHKQIIDNIRAASSAVGQRIAILADLPGPKIRIGQLSSETVELLPGSFFTLTTRAIVGDAQRASVSFSGLPLAVKPGDMMFLNDGLIQLETIKAEGQEITCRVLAGGELRSRKGLNLPGIGLGISAFTERDGECLNFAASEQVDAVSQSFVENAADIIAVRKAASAMDYNPFLIAKIERATALKHIDELLAAADGIMVARGDLGVEIPIERIAMVQKQLIHSANRLGKPVITATQMLESMMDNRRPTRAEATDAANAVLDGTDCVMLSEESAMGKFPVEAVGMLAKIAAATEPHRPRRGIKGVILDDRRHLPVALTDLIALSVDATLERISPAAVFVPTYSGHTARSIARIKPPMWVVGVSSREATCQHLLFSSGIHPQFETDHPGDWNGYVRQWLRRQELEGELAILTEGPSPDHPEANHRMEIIRL
ncbi:MAG: pyruvate kinase [Deltaproteobacteria bacterium]|nr:pyruvate kinase [Deltaproteobacteria bacterium]